MYSSTGFVVNEALLVQVFTRVRPSSTFIIIAPLFHTHLLVALTRRTKSRSLEIFQKEMYFSKLYCVPNNIVLGETPFAKLPVCTVSNFSKGIRGGYKTLQYDENNFF